MRKLLATVARYSRLYLHFIRFSFASASAFRIDAIFRLMMDLLFYGITFLYSHILYRFTGSLGGWSEEQFILFLSCYLLIDAVGMAIYADGMWVLWQSVSKGDLDFHLVRPVSPFFVTVFKDFNLPSAFNLIFVLGIVGWSMLQNWQDITAFNLILFAGFTACGLILSFILRFLITVPVFWVPSGEGWFQAYFSLTYLSRIPDTILNGWVRRLLLTFLPFALFASLPTRALFEGASLSSVALTILVVIFFIHLASILWRHGLQSYGSASS